MATGAGFVLVRDIVCAFTFRSFSSKTEIFNVAIYIVFGILGGVIGMLVKWLWNI